MDDREILERKPCKPCAAMQRLGVSVGADESGGAAGAATASKPAEKINPIWYWALGLGGVALYFYLSDSNEQAIARHRL